MRNICEELWHNLRSGTSVNLILILLFALFFWQGTVISTYFADITSSSAPGRQKNGEYCYYSLENIYSTGDDASRMYQDQDPTAVENMDRTYREIHEELGDRYFSYNEISMQRDYEELSRRFTDEELLSRNAAKAKAYDGMLFVLAALMVSFALMGADMAVVLLLVFAYLFIVGEFIYYLNKYQKEM